MYMKRWKPRSLDAGALGVVRAALLPRPCADFHVLCAAPELQIDKNGVRTRLEVDRNRVGPDPKLCAYPSAAPSSVRDPVESDTHWRRAGWPHGGNLHSYSTLNGT